MLDGWHIPTFGPLGRPITRRGALRLIGLGAATAALAPALAGATARSQPTHVRRNARDLSASERRAFVDAVLELKRRPSPWTAGLSVHDQFVRWHVDTMQCNIMAAHMSPAFLPWHRMYLYLYELELRRVDPSISIPYWDWSVDTDPRAYLWQDDFLGGDGDPAEGYAVTTGPFRRGAWDLTVFDPDDDHPYPYLVRGFGLDPRTPTLPTPAQGEEVLEVPAYDAPPWDWSADPTRSFRNAIEGWRECGPFRCEEDPSCAGPREMHNRVHIYVAGRFGQGDDTRVGAMNTGASPNDPTFFLLHAFVDRLWVEWERRHGAVYAPLSGGPHGHNLDDLMWPYHQMGQHVTPRTMLDHHALDYAYDIE